MRDMDVLSPGNSRDRCQHLQANPRREGLPRTVTEWRKEREERRKIRREERRGLGNSDIKSDSEGEELSAFDILNSTEQELGKEVRRSERIRSGRRGTKGSQKPLGSSFHRSASSTQKAVLTLTPDEGLGERSGTIPEDPPSTKSVDLGAAKPSGVKKGSPPEGFLYALQEPPTVGKKIINIKNAIQVMDTTCLDKKVPEKPRAAIICSNHLNMWPISEHCSRDMAVGLLKDTNLGDIYVVSLYCDGEKRAVPRFFRRFRNIAKK